MKYRIAVIKHSSIPYEITGLLKDWRAWEHVVFGGRNDGQKEELELLFVGDVVDKDGWKDRSDSVRWYTNSHPLEWKSFGLFQTETTKKEWWGLTTPQEWIHTDVPLLEAGLVDCVIFMYQKPREMDDTVTSWTRFGTFYEDTDFIEIAIPELDNEKREKEEALRYLTHEIRHALVRRAHRRGIPVPDVMDMTPTKTGWKPYYKEFDIEAQDGNRAVQDRLLINHWDEVEKMLPTKKNPTLLHWMINMLRLVMPIEEKAQQDERVLDEISLWADAIQEKEGWYVGSCSYRGNNPGNVRYVGQRTAIGSHKCNTSEYALFPDYKTGRKYLEDMLTSHAMGTSVVYNGKAKEIGKHNSGEMTMYEWAQVYAPSGDSNNPRAYAEFVVKRLREKGVDITLDNPIKTLIQ